MANRPVVSPLAWLRNSRASAITLMVVGAVAFMAALTFYRGEVLCMLGSTLLVFLGLFWNIQIRRALGTTTQAREIQWSQPAGSGEVPMHSMMREFAPAQQSQVLPEAGSLSEQVQNLLLAQNAGFQIEAEREGRSILLARSAAGTLYTIFIIEDIAPVGVADLRALSAMRVEHRTSKAVMVSGSSFTQQAITWSSEHDIELLDADQLDLFEL